MTAALDWTPDPYLPHSDVIARAGVVTYRVTTWYPSMTHPGAHIASMGSLDLGRFPYTPEGKRAALMTCQAHADLPLGSPRLIGPLGACNRLSLDSNGAPWD
jgi:hypothetical protein